MGLLGFYFCYIRRIPIVFNLAIIGDNNNNNIRIRCITSNFVTIGSRYYRYGWHIAIYLIKIIVCTQKWVGREFLETSFHRKCIRSIPTSFKYIHNQSLRHGCTYGTARDGKNIVCMFSTSRPAHATSRPWYRCVIHHRSGELSSHERSCRIYKANKMDDGKHPSMFS